MVSVHQSRNTSICRPGSRFQNGRFGDERREYSHFQYVVLLGKERNEEAVLLGEGLAL